MRITNFIFCFIIIIGFCSGSTYAALDWSLEEETFPAELNQKTILSVNNPGRYSIRVSSDSGAALRIIDSISGMIGRSGKTGKTDGRIDVFLDKGEYRLIIDGDVRDKESVKVEVRRFVKKQENQQLPGLEVVSSYLKDYQICDYWFTMESAGEIHVEAAGRSLSDMRLWLNGSWLTADQPRKTISDTIPGQPLTVCRLSVYCSEGTHRISLYGGEPLIWSTGGDVYPVYIRSGIPTMEFAGVYTGTISVFGEDFFHIRSGAEFFRLESSSLNTGLSVKNYDVKSIFPWEEDEALLINDKNQQWVEWKTSDPATVKLVRISGRKGSSYTLRWFPIKLPNNRLMNFDGQYDIGFFLGAESEDFPLLNGLIIEKSRRNRDPGKIIRKSTVSVGSDTSFSRCFNIKKFATFFIDFADAGEYRIFSRGTPARYILEPFLLELPVDYNQPLPSTFPSTISAADKLYILTIIADKPGSMDLMISADAETADWDNADLDPGPFDSWIEFFRMDLSRKKQYLLITNHTGTTQGYFAVESKEPKNRKKYVLLPDKLTGTVGNETKISVPEMNINKSVTIAMLPSETGLVGFQVDDAGIYQVETHGLLRTDCSLRSLMRTKLNGFSIRGNGDNTILQQYLTRGDYFLEVKADYEDRGPVTITAVKLKENYLGQLNPWNTVRCDLSDHEVSMIDLNVPEKGEYRIAATTTTGSSSMRLRLEDESGWPLPIVNGGNSELDSGTYHLIQIASPYIQASKIAFRTKENKKPFFGKGPHQLDLSTGGDGFWEQTDETCEDHKWMIDLKAETTLTLTLSKGMEGHIILSGAEKGSIKLAEGIPFAEKLDEGIYELTVHPVVRDNMKPYHISVTTNPMVSGSSRTIKCPGFVDIHVADDMIDSPLVLQITSSADTRAVLVYPWSDLTGLVEVSDDTKGDWNPNFVIFPQPPVDYSGDNDYRVHIEPVSQKQAFCKVNFLVPDIDLMTIPVSGKQTMTSAGKLIKLVPDKPVPDAYWIVFAKSKGLFAMSGDIGISDEHLSIVSADSDAAIYIWDIDNRGIEIEVTSDIVIPVYENENAGTVSWKSASLNDIKVSVAAMNVDSAGFFHLNCSPAEPQVFLCKKTPEIITDDPVAVENRLVIYTKLQNSNLPPQVTINRFVLNQDNPAIETSADGILDVELMDNQTGIVQMRVNHEGENLHKILRYGSAGMHKIDLRNVFPELSLVDMIEISLSVFLKTSSEFYDSEYGTSWLDPGNAAQIHPGGNNSRVSLSLDNGLVAFDGNTALNAIESTVITGGHPIDVFNTGLTTSGIAWTTNPVEMKTLKSISAEHGEGPRIFLGPAQLQPFKFYLPESRTIGVSIKCSSGHVRARIVDPDRHVTGVKLDDAKGLVINSKLAAGYYVLEVSLPPGAPPSVIQPYFVFDNPEKLNLFGKEE